MCHIFSLYFPIIFYYIGTNKSDNDDDDDDSYDVVRKLSAGSGASGERTTPTPSSGSSSSVVNRNNDRTQSSFSSSFGSPSRRAGDDGKNGSGTARSFARWRRKRSAPLYSVVRFRSSPGWRGAGEDDRSSSANDATGGRRRRRGRPCRGRWDYVADNVRLGKEEEEALRSEGGDDDDDDFGGDRDEEDGTSDDDDEDDEGGDERMATACHDNRTIGEDSVGILIRLYRATLEDCLCSRDDDDDDDDVDGGGGVDSTTAADHPTTADHLLLGPIAHLIGLVCAKGVSVRNLRSILVRGGEGGG